MYVRDEVSSKIIIEKSKFICYVRYCENEEDYKSYINQIRKKHYDATHVCSALITDKIKRSSDDGEPAGTAGVPILNVLEKNNLTNTCALVVRYFGGIKLGAGGLIRAYSQAVSNTLKEATIAEEIACPKYLLTVSYEIANKLNYYIVSNTYLLDTKYDEDVTFTFCVDDAKKLDYIVEVTKGLKPETIGFELIEKVVQ